MPLTDLMNAPAYDPTRDNQRRNVIIGVIATIFVLGIITFVGYVMGHGWLFTNLGYEHRVNTFFDDLEAKDYTKAFAIYFELTNLAETNHRKRRRRAAHLLASRTPVDGSFRGTLARMKSAGVSARAVVHQPLKAPVQESFPSISALGFRALCA